MHNAATAVLLCRFISKDTTTKEEKKRLATSFWLFSIANIVLPTHGLWQHECLIILQFARPQQTATLTPYSYLVRICRDSNHNESR